MTLKELRNITAMLNTIMPDDAQILINIPNYLGSTPIDNSYTPNTKDNTVTFYGEGY